MGRLETRVTGQTAHAKSRNKTRYIYAGQIQVSENRNNDNCPS